MKHTLIDPRDPTRKWAIKIQNGRIVSMKEKGERTRRNVEATKKPGLTFEEAMNMIEKHAIHTDVPIENINDLFSEPEERGK